VTYLHASANLRKATVSFFVFSVPLPIRIKQHGSHSTNLVEFWVGNFLKSLEKIQIRRFNEYLSAIFITLS
jgi:hypothetical protein